MKQIEKWKIGNDELVYYDDTHTYFCNGVKCISVTQLLKFKFPRKYDGVSDQVLNKAAERGNKVHESIEMYCKYGIPSEELEEFRNFMFLKKMFGFEVKANEVPIILKYKDLIVCGRLDLVLLENEELMLGDIKSTSALDKEYLAYQLNLYRLAYQQCYGVEIKGLRGVHLRKDVRKYVQLPINEELTYQLLDAYIGHKERITELFEYIEHKERMMSYE